MTASKNNMKQWQDRVWQYPHSGVGWPFDHLVVWIPLFLLMTSWADISQVEQKWQKKKNNKQREEGRKDKTWIQNSKTWKGEVWHFWCVYVWLLQKLGKNPTQLPRMVGHHFPFLQLGLSLDSETFLSLSLKPDCSRSLISLAMSFFLTARFSVRASTHWPHVLSPECVTLCCRSPMPNWPMSFILFPFTSSLTGSWSKYYICVVIYIEISFSGCIQSWHSGDYGMWLRRSLCILGPIVRSVGWVLWWCAPVDESRN